MGKATGTLIVEGYGIPASATEEVEARMRSHPFTATMLTATAEDVCEREFGTREPGMRLADRLIQRHRKAGNITHGFGSSRRRWTWTRS